MPRGNRSGYAGAERGGNELSLREIARRAFRETLADEDLETERGVLFSRVARLDADLRAGINWGPGDIPYPEYLGLEILRAERDRYQEEKMNEVKVDSAPRKWSNVG